MASSLMATQTTLILHQHIASLDFGRLTATVLLTSAHLRRLPLRLSFSPLRKPSKSTILAPISPRLELLAIKSTKTPNSGHDLLSRSTRTVTMVFAVAVTATKFFAGGIFSLAVQLKEPFLSAAGPAFFVAMKEVPTGSLNVPFTVVAAGMAKWLDIYSGVLMVRVLLSRFPNIPWDRQPLSAIRNLCDSYLNLFRNIIPPIFDTLDVSPLLAFAFWVHWAPF